MSSIHYICVHARDGPCGLMQLRLRHEVNAQSRLGRVGKPTFTLNLQQLKAVHHVYEGNDVLGKSQIRNVSNVQC